MDPMKVNESPKSVHSLLEEPEKELKEELQAVEEFRAAMLTEPAEPQQGPVVVELHPLHLPQPRKPDDPKLKQTHGVTFCRLRSRSSQPRPE